MIKHYFKSAIRNILRQKLFSVINIFGLSISFAAAFLILLYVITELTYDQCHSKHKRVYRINSESELNGRAVKRISSPYPLAEDLKATFPEVEATFRMFSTEDNTQGTFLKVNENFIQETKKIQFADKGIFDILDIPLIVGSKEQVFKDGASCVISEKMAKKYFGDDNPVGQTIIYKKVGEKVLKVDGVFQDIPPNSTFQADIIINIEDFIPNFFKDKMRALNFCTYVLFNTIIDENSFNKKISNLIENKYSDLKLNTKFSLQNLSDIYLKSSNFQSSILAVGDLSTIRSFSLIAIMILLLSIINYIIISTVQGEARAKEIGIRKTIGGQQKSIIVQFLFESMLLCFFCLPTALVLVEIFLPKMNLLLDKNLSINYYQNWVYTSGVIFLTLLTGLLSGCYVSIYLSRFNPIQILNHSFQSGGKKNNFIRKVLIIIQLIIFIGLISSTIIVYKQLNYLYDGKLGYNENNLVSLNTTQNSYLYKHFQSFRNDLLQDPNIEDVSAAYTGINSMARHGQSYKVADSESSENMSFPAYFMESNYLATVGVKFIEGRDFHHDSKSDSASVILNESAVSFLSLTNPIGKQIYRLGKKYKIIGVTQNFVTTSLMDKPEPIAMFLMDTNFFHSQIIIRLKSQSSAAIQHISNTWKKYVPESPMSLNYFENINTNKYSEIENLGKSIRFFTFISIAIAVIGLFGLSLFTARKRTKEIGIRKVFGASVPEILQLITREFLVLILIANLIAWPISWYFMDKWLQNISYRISIDIWIYLLTGLVSFLVVISVMSFNAIKASNANPVDSLRHE